MENTVLYVDNITKIINKTKIIDGLSFKIKKGEVCGFIGANGAGKTTTMRMILSLTFPTAGSIYIDNINLKDVKNKPLSYISGIIEAPSLFKYMTAKENLIYRTRTFNMKLDMDRVSECLDLVGLSLYEDVKVDTFSLGMRQRLGIAMCIITQPKLIILDEPINGLDPKGVVEIRNLIKYLSKEKGIAFLISSHLISELEQVADKIIILDRGKKVIDQTIREIQNSLQQKDLFEIEINHDSLEDAIEICETEEIPYVLHGENTNKIIINIPKEKLPHVYKNFLNRGIHFYTVTRRKNSLEEKFLNLLKGEKNVFQ